MKKIFDKKIWYFRYKFLGSTSWIIIIFEYNHTISFIRVKVFIGRKNQNGKNGDWWSVLFINVTTKWYILKKISSSVEVHTGDIRYWHETFSLHWKDNDCRTESLHSYCYVGAVLSEWWTGNTALFDSLNWWNNKIFIYPNLLDTNSVSSEVEQYYVEQYYIATIPECPQRW